MNSPEGTLENLTIFLAQLLEPLEYRLQSNQFRLLFAELGLLLPSEAEFDAGLLDKIDVATINLENLERLVTELVVAIDNVEVENIINKGKDVVERIGTIFDAIQEVAFALKSFGGSITVSGFTSAEVDQFADNLSERLVEYLLITRLERITSLTEGLEFIQVIERTEKNGSTHDLEQPFSYIEKRFYLDRLIDFLRRPAGHLESLYGWGSSGFSGELLLQRLASLLTQTGMPAIYDDTVNPATLDIVVLEIQPKSDITPKGLSLHINDSIPIDKNFNLEGDEWEFEMRLAADLTANTEIIVQPGDVITYIPPFGSVNGESYVQWKGGAADSFFLVLGQTDGSRLEAAQFMAKSGVTLFSDSTQNRAEGELTVIGTISRAQLFIDISDADGFISEILPKDGPVVDFDLEMGFSNQEGFFIRGSSTLEIRFPIHISFGPAEIQALTIDVGIGNRNISTSLGVDIKTELGPLTATVENLGLTATFSFPSDMSGNLGPLDFSMDFKPPTGIGLVIDGGGFKGGGLLDFEPDNQRYVGFLELEFKKKITLKALGLLTTSLPDGSDGYSLLIIITAEFNPIQLGFGFTLNGVGGLLGLHRTANVERLRTGVKDNTLSSILFPQDIVANAGRIISDLRQVFPAQQDHFIFGPMAKIEWGTPTLITIDLGLMLEVPSPVRLYILGVVRAQIPNEEERKKQEEEEGREIPRVLQLQVNFLGVVDFDAQRLAFDASLYDSRLLTFPLSGDMAVRFSWGAEPNFLLTVGGFHPAYEPPPLALPTLQRLTLPLLSGSNPRLIMETYFAITSNTVQFGARLELYATKSKFNVSGFLSYDVLFQFNPFYFIADIGAMLALRVGSRDIASISLSLTLEGPTPWHARGTAKFKICWFFTLKLRFNKTFGEESETRLDDVTVLPLLQAALSNKGNWEAQLPVRRHALVSLREFETGSGDILIDPSGVLSINQKVVPLNVTIEKFGNQQPADAKRFAIEKLRIGPSDDSEDFDIIFTQESFAPAQFFEKSDAQKLASKSFERYDSGVELGQTEQLTASYAVQRPVAYELYYIDEQRNQRLRRRPGLLVPDLMVFNAWSTQGAIAASPLSFSGNAKSALAPDAVQVLQEQFSVVNISDLRPFNDQAFVASEAGAYSLMSEMIHNNPALEGELQVVPGFEASRGN